MHHGTDTMEKMLSETGRLPFFLFAEWIVAPVRLALLNLSIDLKIPDILTQYNDLEGIAAEMGTEHPDKLAYILDAMAASGLLRKNEGCYYNSSLTNDNLRTTEPAYLGELVRSLQAMQHRNIGRLQDFLFTEVLAPEVNDSLRHEDLWRRSARSLAAYQKSGIASRMANIAASLPRAETFTKMLDIGCGPAVTTLHMLQRLSQLQAVLCDFQPVLDVAMEETCAAGLEQRVSFVPGDYNTQDWGRGFNLVWACQSLYYVHDLSAFFSKIYDSLEAGGYCISIHEGIHGEGTMPSMLILSRLSLALEGQDVSFAWGTIAKAATQAGFIREQTGCFPLLYGESDLEIFRKPFNEGVEQ
ncbi:hypothetical protein KBAD11_09350 [Aeromonas dhakensis]|nr:type 12 methyltransferase [Aeromonas hydrophila ML09-119]AHX31625.1 hypothetical protein V428_05895 [Aeromonas hydrophila subsp. hydrophila AL09-71]AJE38657.1 hypothetical protein V469_17450 [Aeromonas hydrophila J-1]AKJ37089.1 hypothetical protein U876_18075 [Aeromonas hydrophila NJ-35]ALQ64635.1 hypothetical protein AS145_17640 [Aeromonas hydrophila]ANB70417.1 hypothetical protein A6033_19325 [Aeromonas veronii]CAD7490172.1 hypothetical protein KBAD45_09350 [Aeromonas dhakensis]